MQGGQSKQQQYDPPNSEGLPELEGLRSTTVGKRGTRSIYIETCASYTKTHGPWRITYCHRDVCIIYKDVASPSAPYLWNLHAGRRWHAGK